MWKFLQSRPPFPRFLPVKSQVVTRLDLDRVRHLLVTEDVAAHIDRVQVLYRRVGVAPWRRPVVGRGPNAAERSLIDAIDEDTLIKSREEISFFELRRWLHLAENGQSCSPKYSNAHWRRPNLRQPRQLRAGLRSSLCLLYNVFKQSQENKDKSRSKWWKVQNQKPQLPKETARG